jgi:NADH-quinone oxidoreductase subunit L
MYAFWCADIAAALTAFYTWRLMFMTFFGRRGEWSASLPRAHDGHDHGDHGHGDHPVHESPLVMLIPLAVLALGATFAGMAFRHLFIGGGFETFWRNSLFLGTENHILEEMEHAPALVSLSPTLFMLAGFAVAYYMYLVDLAAPQRLATALPGLYRFLLNKWYFDELYDFLFVRPAFAIGRFFWKGGDGAVIDGFGPDGVSARVLDVARSAVRLQTGYVYHYAFAILIGAAALTTWYLFGGVIQ